MTAEQALQILSQATGQVNLPRAAHLQIMEAIEVIRKLIPKQTDKVDEKKDGK